MEGDGEGMLAIVQSLDPSGVSLTLISRPRQYSDRRGSPKPKIPYVSTAETSTDSAKQTSTGVQITDGRYASSYKLAHCKLTPTSPQEAVTEFPPQRKESCRNQGNFEVGGQGSRPSGPTSSRARHYETSQTWGEKDSLYRTKSSRGTEAFAHTLRKYPSMAPVRVMSDDLIEKLIQYTQNKHSSKTSRPTKSMRSLHKRSSDTDNIPTVSQHQQTYTRRQNNENDFNIGNAQLGYRGRTRHFKLYSPVSDSRNIKESKNTGTTFNTSYDYLKAGSSRFGRLDRSDRSRSPDSSRTERPSRSEWPSYSSRPIRFERSSNSIRDVSISEMSRYIRSTIRQMYNERPVVFQVCPKLQNRYNQHKKVCPEKRNDSAGLSIGSQFSGLKCVHSKGTQDAFNYACTGIPTCKFDDPEPLEPDYCDCCINAASKSSQDRCSCKNEAVKVRVECHCRPDDQTYFNNIIDEEISEWLKDVPVHSIESPESINKREIMINKLRKTLKGLPDNKNFGKNVTNEIQSFIDDFPIWNPGKDKENMNDFKQQMADNLIERIINIPRKPDRFRDIVKKWIKDIDFADEDVDMKEIIYNVVKKLKSLAANRPENDSKYQHMLVDEIIEMLEELPQDFDDNRHVLFNKLAYKLAVEIVSLPRNVDLSEDRNDLTHEFEEDEDWINDCSTRDNIDELKQDPKLIHNLAKRSNKLQSQGINDEDFGEEARQMIVQDINSVIDNSAIPEDKKEELKSRIEYIIDNNLNRPSFDSEGGQDIAKETLLDDIETAISGLDLPNQSRLYLKSKLSNAVINNFNKSLSRLRKSENNLEESIANEVQSVVNELPLTTHKKKDLMHQVKGTLSKTINKTLPDDVKHTISREISDILEKYPISGDKHIVDNVKEKLLAVVSKNLNLFSPMCICDIQGKVEKDISIVIDSCPIDEDKKRYLKQSIQNILTENEDQRLSLEVKETVKEEIISVVSDLSIPQDTKNDLKNTVIETVSKDFDEASASERHDTNKIKNKLSKANNNTIESAPVDREDKKHLKNKLRPMLDRNLDSSLSGEQKKTIIKDVSNIFKDTMSENENSKLRKKIANKIDAKLTPKFLTDDIKNTIEEDIIDIIDDSSISKDEKNVIKRLLKSKLDNYLGQPIANLKTKIQKEMTDVIENSPISKDSKRVFKTKTMNVLTKYLGGLSAEHIKMDDYNNFIKTEDNLEGTNEIENQTQENILQKLAQSIDEATISVEEKTELKNKLKELVIQNFKQPLNIDIQDVFTDSINDILEDISLPDEMKNEIKSELMDIVNENISSLQDDTKKEKAKHLEKLKTRRQKNVSKNLLPIEEVDESEIKESVLDGLEKTIEEAPIPMEKKTELKKRMKDMATAILKKPLSDDVQDALKDGIIEILDELPLSQNKKNKLTRDLTDIVDVNMRNLNSEVKRRYSDSAGSNSPGENDLKKFVKQNLLKPAETFETKAYEDIIQEVQETVNKSQIPDKKKRRITAELTSMIDANLRLMDEPQDDVSVGSVDSTSASQGKIKKCYSRCPGKVTSPTDDDESLEVKMSDTLIETVNDCTSVSHKKIKKRYSKSPGESRSLIDDDDSLEVKMRDTLIEIIDDCTSVSHKKIKKSYLKSPRASTSQADDNQALKEKIRDTLISDSEDEVLKKKIVAKRNKNSISKDISDANEKSDVSQTLKARSKILEKSEPHCRCYLGVDDVKAKKFKAKSMEGINKMFKTSDSGLGFDQEESQTTESLREGQMSQEYLNKLKESIRTWLDDLPINLDPEVKTVVINGLSSDILDRVKYLKVHPETSFSNKDELEHLKYQVFRRFSKVVDPLEMPTIIKDTEELFKMIMDVEVPPYFPKLRRISQRG